MTDRQTDGRTDRRTDRQNYNFQDRASISASRGKKQNKINKYVSDDVVPGAVDQKHLGLLIKTACQINQSVSKIAKMFLLPRDAAMLARSWES